MDDNISCWLFGLYQESRGARVSNENPHQLTMSPSQPPLYLLTELLLTADYFLTVLGYETPFFGLGHFN